MSSSGSDGGRSAGKCFLVLLILFGVKVQPSWSTCPAPSTIKSGTVLVLPPNSKPNGSGKYAEGAEARIDCHPGYRLSYPEYGDLTCTNGEWKHDVRVDESICVPIQCGRPPPIDHGHYAKVHEKTQFKLGDRAGETYPFSTMLVPTCEMHYALNCTRHCGRIVCGADGSWTAKDDGKYITECVHEALRSNLSPANEDRGTGSSSSETGLKHYLIIALAVICILIVGALTILLLRRPAFCKKHGGRSSSGGTGTNFHPNMMRNCDESSVSPTPAALDSLPVAMNTGIFVPGGSYDWQECRFQESTLTGTSVFK